MSMQYPLCNMYFNINKFDTQYSKKQLFRQAYNTIFAILFCCIVCIYVPHPYILPFIIDAYIQNYSVRFLSNVKFEFPRCVIQ